MERKSILFELITRCPQCNHVDRGFFPKLICSKCFHYKTNIIGHCKQEFVSFEDFEEELKKEVPEYDPDDIYEDKDGY